MVIKLLIGIYAPYIYMYIYIYIYVYIYIYHKKDFHYVAILSLDHGFLTAQHNIPPSTQQWVKVLPSTGILPYISNDKQSQRSKSRDSCVRCIYIYISGILPWTLAQVLGGSDWVQHEIRWTFTTAHRQQKARARSSINADWRPSELGKPIQSPMVLMNIYILGKTQGTCGL